MAHPRRLQSKHAERIDCDENGNLDDVALSDVTSFRLEYMDDNHVWMRIERADHPAVVINLSARGKIKGIYCYD